MGATRRLVGPAGSPTAGPQGRRRALARLGTAVIAYGLSKAMLMLVALVTILVFAPASAAMGHVVAPFQSSDPAATSPINMWFRWDSGLYLQLVQQDYAQPLSAQDRLIFTTPDPAPEFNPSVRRFAFAPMLPLLSKLVLPLTLGHPKLAMLVVVNVAGVACLWLVAALAEELLGAAAGRDALVLAVGCPVAMFLHSASTESLFAATSVGSLYLARRGRWWWAGGLGLLCALTRSYGFLLCVPLALLALAAWRRDRAHWLERSAAVLAPALGWGLYLVYCRVMTGQWLAYAIAQRVGWGVKTRLPWTTLAEGLGQPPLLRLFAVAVMVVIALCLLALVVVPLPEAIFSLIVAVVPLTIGAATFHSILRYEFGLVSLWLLAAALCRRRPAFLAALLGCGCLLQGLLMVLWQLEWTATLV